MATNSYVKCRTCDGTGYGRKLIFFKKICALCFGIGYRRVDYDIKRYRPMPGPMPRRQRVEEVKATSRSEVDSLALAGVLNTPCAPTPEPCSGPGSSFGGAGASCSWSESSSESSNSSSSSDRSSSSSDGGSSGS